MKKIYVSSNLELVRRFSVELDAEGIPCAMRNEFPPAAGEIVPAVAWPELWVINDADEQAALDFIAASPYRE